MKKARASKLDPYAEKLAFWLKPKPEGEGLTLSDAKARLKKEHNLDVHESRISTWFQAYQQREMESKLFADIANGSRVLGEVKKATADSPTSMRPLMALLETFIAKLAVHGDLGQQVELLPGLLRTALQGNRLELDREKLDWVKARAQKADEAETVTRDTTLTEEEKQARYRTIFGLA